MKNKASELKRLSNVVRHVEKFGYWKKVFLFLPKRVDGKLSWLRFAYKKYVVGCEEIGLAKSRYFYRSTPKYTLDKTKEDMLEFEDENCKMHYERLLEKINFWSKK